MDAKNPHAHSARASNVAANNSKFPTIPGTENPTIVDRSITIGRGDKGLFMVSVTPPTADHPPQLFDNYRQARGFAGGLRMCCRWQIVDETGGGK